MVGKSGGLSLDFLKHHPHPMGISKRADHSVFLGQHSHNLDDKGRINIPAPFRKVIQGMGDDRIILTRSKDPCLMGYTVPAWENLLLEYSKKASLDPELEAFERIYAANASLTSLDTQGRILVPQYLREYAGLEKDVIFAGRLSKFELWHPNLWKDAVTKAAEILANYHGKPAGG